MTSLVLSTTKPSSLFIEEALLEQNRTGNDVIVVSSTVGGNSDLKQAGLPSQNIYMTIPESFPERDAAFAELAMPGVFQDATFPDTHLEIWKVLSIDRLSFWNGGKPSLEFINMLKSLRWDKLITDLNIYSNYPFAALGIAKNRGVHAKAVQVHPLRTKEFFDIAPHVTFDEVVVNKGDESLARRVKGKVIAKGVARQKPIASRDGQGLRNGLGYGPMPNERIVGVIFDKLYESQARMFIKSFNTNSGRLVVFTLDDRSKALLPKCLRPYHNKFTHHDISMHPICNEIIAFGWHEDLQNISRCKIVDNGIAGAKDIAPEGIEVEVMNEYS